MARKKIGEILIEKGHLDASQLSRALELKSQSDKKIGQILVSEGIITPEQVAEAFSEQTGIPLIPEDFLKRSILRSFLIFPSVLQESSKRCRFLPIQSFMLL